MAFKKSDKFSAVETNQFQTCEEAVGVFENDTVDEALRLEALEYIIKTKDICFILNILCDKFNENILKDHVYINYVFANFDTKQKNEEDFAKLFEMLKGENAYLRNAVIRFLQDYGREAKWFIKKLMDDSDRDIRIFAINILGDVNYDDSIEMLRYFIAKEKDVNALMTAVDYIGEIGDASDIKLLEAVKIDYSNEPYVLFGVDLALNRLKGENV